MNLDEIKPFLDQHTSVDVSIAYKAFRDQSGSGAVDDFLVFLLERGYLGKGDFLEIHAQTQEVEVTSFESTRASTAGGSPSERAALEAGGEEALLLNRLKRSGGARYAMLGLVGEGGMGEVHVAKDLELRRKVALKQLKPRAAEQPAVVDRFLNEAQITAQLDHPNVVPVYTLEVGTGGRVSYAMKLVQGKTLKALIAEARALSPKGVPIDEACSLPVLLEHFVKVCDAIDFAHSKGVIHRDLKPENIMVGRYNEVYVMDWGIARLLHRTPVPEEAGETTAAISVHSQSEEELPSGDVSDRIGNMTHTGDLLGTPRYMSPEQAEGRNAELDGKSDQYALGLILFELCSLRKAIPGEAALDVWRNAQGGVKVPLVHASPNIEIDVELKAIVDKATALRPADRYPSVRDLAEDVRRYMRGDAVTARPDNAIQKLTRAMARHRLATLVIVASIVLGSAGSSLSWVLYQRESAAVAAKARNEKENRFLMAVARQGQEVNAWLMRFEAMVEGTAATAAQSLTRGTPSEEPAYFKEDFTTAGRQPPDLSPSRFYNGPVSLGWPVWLAPKGATRDAIVSEVQRLNPIRGELRRSFLQSAALERKAAAQEDAGRAILEEGGPILGWYIGLTDGTTAVFPGMTHIPDDYDPRTRPWYTLSAGKRHARWGNPYIDRIRGERVLSCSASFFDQKDVFLGVTGMNVTFKHILRQLLTLPDASAVKEVLLLDDQARVVVRGGARGAQAEDRIAVENAMELSLFEVPEVVREIREQRSGHLDLDHPTGAALVTFNRMSVLGWYYVVIADVVELVGY